MFCCLKFQHDTGTGIENSPTILPLSVFKDLMQADHQKKVSAREEASGQSV